MCEQRFYRRIRQLLNGFQDMLHHFQGFSEINLILHQFENMRSKWYRHRLQDSVHSFQRKLTPVWSKTWKIMWSLALFRGSVSFDCQPRKVRMQSNFSLIPNRSIRHRLIDWSSVRHYVILSMSLKSKSSVSYHSWTIHVE